MSVTGVTDSNGRAQPVGHTPGNSQLGVFETGTQTTDSATGTPRAQLIVTEKDDVTNVKAKVLAGGDRTVSGGGALTAPVAAAAAAAAIKAAPGVLHKVLVTTLGTAALTFYDNTSAASGTIIGVIAASAAAGTVTTFDMPATAGIFCNSGTNTPAVTVSYS
jgi:hypothetical protein